MTLDEWKALPLIEEDRARSMAKRFTQLWPVDGTFHAAEMAASLAERHGAVIFGKGGTVAAPVLYGSYEGKHHAAS